MAGIVNTHYMYCGQKAALNFTYTGTYNVRDDGVVELLTSGTLVFLDPAVIDIFCVGGGGMGGTIGSGYGDRGAAGGAGGYTATSRAVNVAGSYPVTIGAGGNDTTSLNGGATSFGNLLTAEGGEGASQTGGTYSARKGKDGGSGSGGGVDSNSDYGTGGSNGGNGESGYPPANLPGGTGQGATTREFGETTGKLYAGGGAGGRYMVSSTPIISLGGAGGGGSGAWVGTSASTLQAAAAGVANTGGGGGGGARHTAAINAPGATGGSGICCFRTAK